MLSLLSMVALTRDIPEHGVRKGVVGTVVHVYPDGAAYEVEFGPIDGESMPVKTLEPGDIRLATRREIERAFQNATAAK